MMLGFALAVLTSLFYGLQGTYGKVLTRQFSPAVLAWGTFTFTTPILLVVLFIEGTPNVNWPDFLRATGVSFMVNVFAYYLFFKALSLSPLSLTMPFTAFTPLFMVPIAFFVLGELPGLRGVAGILLIISGAYGLHLNSKKLIQPFKNLFREKGTRYMLVVALVWAVSASVEKVAVLSSSPLFYGVVIDASLAAAYLPYVCFFHGQELRSVPLNLKKFSGLGLISAVMVITQFSAYKYLLASYVIAFKRAGVIFSVLLGYIIFKEKKIKKNLFFTLLMVAGAALLMLD